MIKKLISNKELNWIVWLLMTYSEIIFTNKKFSNFGSKLVETEIFSYNTFKVQIEISKNGKAHTCIIVMLSIYKSCNQM